MTFSNVFHAPHCESFRIGLVGLATGRNDSVGWPQVGATKWLKQRWTWVFC